MKILLKRAGITDITNPRLNTQLRTTLWRNLCQALYNNPDKVVEEAYSHQLINKAVTSSAALVMPTEAYDAPQEPLTPEVVDPDVPTQQERNIALAMTRAIKKIDNGFAKRLRMGINVKRGQNKLPLRDVAFIENLIVETLIELKRDSEITSAGLSTVVAAPVVTERIDAEPKPVVAPVAVEHVAEVVAEVVDVPATPTTIEDGTELNVLQIALRARAAMIEEWTTVQESLTRISNAIDEQDAQLAELESQAETLGETLGNMTTNLFSQDTGKLLSHCTLDINSGDFKTSPRSEVEQSSASLESILAQLQIFRDLKAEVETMREAINALHKEYQALSASSQRAQRFHREATQKTFGVSMQEFLTDEDRGRVQEIPEFIQALSSASKQVGLVDQSHIQGMESVIAEAEVAGNSPEQLEAIFTEALQRVQAFLNPQQKKKTAPAPAAEQNGTPTLDDLPALELSPLQTSLIKLLTAQTGNRHPKHTTWGFTAATIRQFWIETFGDNDTPSEAEIYDALSETQLTEDVPVEQMDYRPSNIEMRDLRVAQQYISLWANRAYQMFLPTHQLFAYAEQSEMTLETEDLNRLQAYRAAQKDKRKKQKWGKRKVTRKSDV